MDRGTPAHVVAKWIGHSVKVQNDNYAQVDDHHFAQFNAGSKQRQIASAAGELGTDDSKSKVAHQVAQKTSENATTVKRRKDKNPAKLNVLRGSSKDFGSIQFNQVPEAGVEQSEFSEDYPALLAKAKEAVVQAATSVKDAPIVVPAVDTGVSGMRTALRALYSMVIQEYRAIVNVTGVLYKAASQRVEGVTMASVARQLNAYRRAAHTVFRYIYQLRVLQLRALRRAGLEDVVERVTELMSLPGAGDDVVVDGDVKVEGLEKPFTDAKNALHRFAQTSTRLLLTNSELFEPAKRKLAQRITRVAGNHLARAKTSLDELVQLLGTVNEAEGAAEADLEKAGGR